MPYMDQHTFNDTAISLAWARHAATDPERREKAVQHMFASSRELYDEDMTFERELNDAAVRCEQYVAARWADEEDRRLWLSALLRASTVYRADGQRRRGAGARFPARQRVHRFVRDLADFQAKIKSGAIPIPRIPGMPDDEPHDVDTTRTFNFGA